MLAALDRLEQVAGVVVGVHRHQRVGLGLGEVLDALVGDEVILAPRTFSPAALTHMKVCEL